MEFSIAIARTELSKLVENFNKSKCFSLFLDEATDVYRLEQCIAYVRFSVRGEIFTKFLGIRSVVRPNAEQITDCIIAMLMDTLMWSPPDVENVISDNVIVNGNEQDNRVTENETAMTQNMDDEVSPSMDDDDIGDDYNQLEVEKESLEYDEVSKSIDTNLLDNKNSKMFLGGREPELVYV